MIAQFMKSLGEWLRRVVTQPREELSRWQMAARFAYDLCRYGGRQLREDRAPQMAAALAFRTLFALVPVLVVAMIVVKALRGREGFLVLTQQVFAAVNLDQVGMVTPATADTAAESTTTLSEWLQELVGQAADVNLGAVGWLGLALICYAAVSLLMTIENSFNTIYRAPNGRAWFYRIPLYWFVLTMSPVAVGVMMYVNQFVATWIASVQAGHWPIMFAGLCWNLFMGWLILFAIYGLLPSTNVSLRTAAVGAIVSALLVEIGKRTLGAYLDNAFTISQLYGSLGLVPLFMFWVYLIWLAVLFGLEVSATLQALHGRDLEKMDAKPASSGLLDPASIISVMEVVAERFMDGKPTAARHAAEECSLTEATVRLMFARLTEQRFLHSVDTSAVTVTLALPPEKVTAEQLMKVGYELVHAPDRNRSSDFLRRLRGAQHQLASRTTLAALIAGEA